MSLRTRSNSRIVWSGVHSEMTRHRRSPFLPAANNQPRARRSRLISLRCPSRGFVSDASCQLGTTAQLSGLFQLANAEKKAAGGADRYQRRCRHRDVFHGGASGAVGNALAAGRRRCFLVWGSKRPSPASHLDDKAITPGREDRAI
jgi:hypothetical protein